MKYSVLISILFFQCVSFSQCISGDCKDGFGKYDYGFAVYEGNFVSEKPNGKGTMDYGNGDKFVGNFKEGQEDGDGILYKKNVLQNVTYLNGKAKVKENQIVIGGNIPKVDGCIQGDCYNGFGIITFESGNRYEGNFVYGVKQGEGKFYFAGGNVFSGNFKDNSYTDGTFTYANEAITFEGNYNNYGSPKTGKYYYETNKATVIIENGIITKIDNPVAERAKKLAEEQSKPRSCSACGGGGMIAGVDRREESEYYYTIDYVRSDGSLARSSDGNVGKSTKTVRGWPTECKKCRGSGQEMPQGIILNTGRY